MCYQCSAWQNVAIALSPNCVPLKENYWHLMAVHIVYTQCAVYEDNQSNLSFAQFFPHKSPSLLSRK